MEFISVVIPLYNKAPYIKRALESVLSQTVKDFEIIVVDDGSTDGSGDLVSKLNDPRIRLIRQTNFGVSAARNRGIAESNGDLIAFLDADDSWKPGFLEKIIFLKGKYPHAGAYATSAFRVEKDGSIVPKQVDILPEDIDDGIIPDYFKVAVQKPLSSSSIAVPKKVLHDIGGFHLYEKLSEDIDTWLRIALHHPIVWCKERLVIIHKDDENRANRTFRFTDEPVISRTIRHMIQAGLVPKSSLGEISEYAAYFQVGAARQCLSDGNRIEALNLLNYAKGTKRYYRKRLILKLFSTIPFKIGTFLWRILYEERETPIKSLIKSFINKENVSGQIR